MSLTPKFLMGGVRLSQNFLGTGTAKAAAYSLAEVALKTAPIAFLFLACGQAGRLQGAAAEPVLLVETDTP